MVRFPIRKNIKTLKDIAKALKYYTEKIIDNWYLFALLDKDDTIIDGIKKTVW